MKPLHSIINYITPNALGEYFGDLFKLRLMINYEIYSKLTPYVAQNKDNKGKIKSLTELLILNKILLTRKINLDDQNKVRKISKKLEGIPTDLEVISSKIILIINDDLNPVNIKSDEIKWYSIINEEQMETYVQIYKEFGFVLPTTLYCSISINKLMLVLSDNKLKNKLKAGEFNLKAFLEQELTKGIEIDVCCL